VALDRVLESDDVDADRFAAVLPWKCIVGKETRRNGIV